MSSSTTSSTPVSALVQPPALATITSEQDVPKLQPTMTTPTLPTFSTERMRLSFVVENNPISVANTPTYQHEGQIFYACLASLKDIVNELDFNVNRQTGTLVSIIVSQWRNFFCKFSYNVKVIDSVQEETMFTVESDKLLEYIRELDVSKPIYFAVYETEYFITDLKDTFRFKLIDPLSEKQVKLPTIYLNQCIKISPESFNNAINIVEKHNEKTCAFNGNEHGVWLENGNGVSMLLSNNIIVNDETGKGQVFKCPISVKTLSVFKKMFNTSHLIKIGFVIRKDNIVVSCSSVSDPANVSQFVCAFGSDTSDTDFDSEHETN